MPKIKNERAWLQSTTPASLLQTLKGKRLPRQRRLIAVACCRRFWEQMKDPRSRQAVEAAERFADGEIDAEELHEAYLAAQQAAMALMGGDVLSRGPRAQVVAWDVWRLAYAAQLCAASSGMDEALDHLRKRAAQGRIQDEQKEKAEQCAIIRDVVGNPFRPEPRLDPAWLAWNGGLISKLAQAIYTERRFLDLPVLGDALEEAGCSDEPLLEHCRSGGTHVRGCRVLDGVLGRL
jgi:uncharacterized membrane protein